MVWAKPNPQPESVTDRPVKAHEYVFLLTRSPRYFYDSFAVREPASPSSLARIAQSTFDQQQGGPKDYRNGHNQNRSARRTLENFATNPGRNLRTVWSIPTEAFPDAHFATFPKALVDPCLRAGTSERGACVECGAPHVRLVERSGGVIGQSWNREKGLERGAMPDVDLREKALDGTYVQRTVGWQATCDHDAGVRPCIVLDPFAGSGTTGVVARKMGLRFVGCELNPEYASMAVDRIRREGRLVQPHSIRRPGVDELTLFD